MSFFTETDNTTDTLTISYFYTSDQVITFVIPAIVLTGIPGNILSFIIMTRKHNSYVSCSIYMTGLAESDFILLVGAADLWLSHNVIFHVSLYGLHYGIMNVHFIFARYGYLLLIAMALDWMIAVIFPLKATTMCTPKRAQIISLVCLLPIFIANIPSIFSHLGIYGILQ